MMTDRAMTKPIRGRQLSKRDLYDEEFFQDYFKNKEVVASEGLENLQEQYHAFQEERDKDKVSTEEIEEAFKTFKEK